MGLYGDDIGDDIDLLLGRQICSLWAISCKMYKADF